MSIRERLSGNEAIAYAMRQINPDVFAAFPHHALDRDPPVFRAVCGQRPGGTPSM